MKPPLCSPLQPLQVGHPYPLGARTAQMPATPLRTPAGLPPQITVIATAGRAHAATLGAAPVTPQSSLLARMTAATIASRAHPPTLRAPSIPLLPTTPEVQWGPAAARA